MADPVADTLLSLAQAFSVTKTQGGNAYSFLLDVLPPTTGRGPLSIVENLIETVIKHEAVDVSWVMKDVRFATSPIADQVPVGGQPIADILIPNLTRTEQGFTSPPGVAGILAAIKGTIPLPVQQTVAKPLDVTFDVRWSVVDENGSTATDVNWTLGGVQGQGGVIPVQTGAALTQLALSFLPAVRELTLDAPLTVKRIIAISVRLTAADGAGAFRATSGWVNLPSLDIILPAIPVPTLAIFFSSKFGGDALVAVPESSPLDEASFLPALDQLNTVLGVIDPFLQIGGVFLGTLITVKDSLATKVSKVVFRKGDSCPDLRSVKFAKASFFDWNGEDGDDHFASLILVGPPNRSIECFNERDLNAGEGQFTLKLDKELCATMWSLASKQPASNPPGASTTPHEPTGRNWGRNRSIDKFENELSSYRFSWA